jgi:Ca2+:H+ antiporter
MIITAVALILPTALYSTFSSESSEIDKKILSFSRGSAIVLLVLYVMYLYFQLGTHAHLFIDAEQDEGTADEGTADEGTTDEGTTDEGTVDEETRAVERTADDGTTRERSTNSTIDEEQEVSTISPYVTSVILVISGVAIMGCTQLLLKSIDQTAELVHISKRFVAAVFIPIASNAPEFATVISQAKKGNTSFAISVIVGSILQIALFIIPFLVTLGWIIRQPMTLYFESFQITILFLAVLAVNRLLKDGVYTYLHGAMLVEL